MKATASTIEPKPYSQKEVKRRIAVVDTETDPFLYGRKPAPFCVGFYDGEEYTTFWGDDCIDQFFDWFTRLPGKWCVYAHNGGNFDFHFMRDWWDEESRPFLIDNRVVQVDMGGQEFRDSYSIIPVPLADYQKDEIDYDLMERERREDHREEILAYMRGDCVYLYELVTGFLDKFGDKLTMAGVALPMLRSFHGFETFTASDDAHLRPFFFGGRCQAFETGILTPREGSWKIYDRNSMYPTVMRDARHPVGGKFEWSRRIGSATRFVRLRARRNDGALCFRHDNGGLDFTVSRGVFYASIHELRAAEETGTLAIDAIEACIDIAEETSFEAFVSHYYEARLRAAAANDEVNKLFYKLVLNSSYGKFALDPEKFEEIVFDMAGKVPPEGIQSPDNPEGWMARWILEGAIIWARPDPRRMRGFINVATAASITGAARADLLRAITGATRPIYCDTDSIICEALDGVTFGDKELGAWKTEAEGDTAAIAGKKLYAVFDAGRPIKRASKGVRLTPDEIHRVAAGEVVEYASPAPKLQLNGEVQWTKRTVRRTAA